ncbi:HtaA domain-containing protein [Streptomyces sp. NPDC056716]|uniref:HtaA domain-containing protein n=1 Tax=unclassified Streptomyces TaxID=2593676 RepID=UPI00367CAEE9
MTRTVKVKVKARKRPAAALVVAGGAVLALFAPGAATAQAAPAGSEISGGYVGWSTAELAAGGLTLTSGTASAGRSWFRAEGGTVDAGSAEVDLAGTASFTSGDEPAHGLLLGELRLTLDGGTGTLYARRLEGDRGEFALAAVRQSGAAPVVRDTGATWSGLRMSLTDAGAELLSGWSGQEFAAGETLGLLDVTVGTGGGTPQAPAAPAGDDTDPATAPPAPADVPESPQPPQPPPAAEPQSPASGAAPTAAVVTPVLTGGGEQRVTGAGFTPGAVVLVAIDGDTRYQAVADATGRFERAFPVYASALAGEHEVELTPVTGGGGGAVARFEVRGTD